jgi:hypothetical protein
MAVGRVQREVREQVREKTKGKGRDYARRGILRRT